MEKTPIRILLVEDNPGDARLLLGLLNDETRLAGQLVHKERLSSALQALTHDNIDLVLLDLSLPDAQGIATLIQLHEQVPRIPIVVLTGLNDEDTATRAVQNGAQDYLVKGQFDGPSLRRAIRYAVERTQADAMERQLLAEQAARAQAEIGEKRFRGLAEAIPQIVWELSAEGGVDYLSARWADYTGQSLTEPLFANSWIHPADAMQVVETWTQAQRQRAVWQFEYRLRRKDGVYRWHLARAHPFFDLNGRVLKWYGTATDIDDQKRAEEERGRLYEQARKAVQSRDDLLGTVSHDLRSPLSSIVMSTQLLQAIKPDAPGSAERVAGYAAMIGRAARRMDHLIRDLLDIASIESGHLSINPARVGVSSLIAEALETLQPLAAEKRQHIEAWPVDSSIFVFCDRNRILQVFANIVGNALKFSPEESVIGLKTRQHDGEIEFSISDRGPGIAPGQLRQVFERFWRAKETGKAGTGLGLAISRGIVEQHRGRIWADSAASGETTFTFTLPVAR